MKSFEPPDRFARTLMAVLAALVTGACEIPTEAPHLLTSWTVPGEKSVVPVTQLLPSGVGVTADTTAFDVSLDTMAFRETLSEVCGSPCELADGTTVPKPAFEHRTQESADLPPDVVEGEVASGRVRIEVRNGFSFDPIRPGGAETGTLSLTVRDGAGGRRLARMVLDGAERSLAPGETVSETRSLEPGPVGPTLVATLELVSPAGDLVTIDISERLEVDVEPTALRVSSARVAVAGWDVEAEPVELAVADLDPTLIEAVRSGTLRLEVTNPFSVSVGATLRIRGPDFETVSKEIEIPGTPTSAVPVEYGREELRRFLGRPDVVLAAEGRVDADADPVRVEPDDVFVLEGPLLIDVEIGGGSG